MGIVYEYGINGHDSVYFRLIEWGEYSTIQMYAAGAQNDQGTFLTGVKRLHIRYTTRIYLPKGEHRYKIAHKLKIDTGAREILWSKR